MKKRVLSILALCTILAGLLGACRDNVVDPKLPTGATKFTPPSFYETWWDMTQSCSGRSGSLSDVTWYEVPASVKLELDGQPVSAYWSAGSNRVVFSSSVRTDGQVIRHEMLHALLRSKGHSRREFLQSCAGYVTCTSKCVEDAGAPAAVPGTVPRVAPSNLVVTTTITPSVVRASVNNGYFSVTVRARNPAPHPVFVQLAGDPGDQVSFSYTVVGPFGEAGSVLARDQEAVSFAAGETKLHIFDFFVSNQGTLQGHIYPGTYTVRGSFGGHAATDLFLQTH